MLCWCACAALFGLRGDAAEPTVADGDPSKTFFNGRDLTGWEGNQELWSVEDGELVGRTKTGLKLNNFLRSGMKLGDFRLIFEVKLVPDDSNSGLQFRSQPVPNSHEMLGYQADIGLHYWGKLYHESGRGALTNEDPPESVVHAKDWNTYEVLAVGYTIRTAINGHKCVDLDDPKGELEGICATQLHSGGPLEVRFKNFRLEINPKSSELKTVAK